MVSTGPKISSRAIVISLVTATEMLLRRTLSELSALPAFEPSVGLRRRVLSEVEALPLPWRQRLGTWFRPALLAPVAGVALAGAVALLVVGGHVGIRKGAVERGTEFAVAETPICSPTTRWWGSPPRTSRWWSTSTS